MIKPGYWSHEGTSWCRGAVIDVFFVLSCPAVRTELATEIVFSTTDGKLENDRSTRSPVSSI
jgi:hypothetical protein